MRVRLVLAAVLVVVGCKPAPPPDPRTTSSYGAGIVAKGEPVALATVLKDPDKYADKAVLTDGKVRAACTRRGCWMELAEAMDKGKPGCRVTFKDYGFFVPTNSQGAEARVEGKVAVRAIAADEVAHLESEGGSFPNKLPDGTAREVRIVATGVELKR